MRKTLLIIVVALVVIGAFGYFLLTRHAPVLTVVSWPGAYGRAQQSALFQPYAQASGVNVHIAEYDGGLAELRSGAKDWDVIDLELPDAIQACREGLLQPLD